MQRSLRYKPLFRIYSGYRAMSTSTNEQLAARSAEILESLAEIRSRVASASSSTPATLVAVSKYKPASDIQACFSDGQLDFGENYVQELEDKAKALPLEIRWHFIGTLQSNKAKFLAAIPNLYSIQTLTSTKAATALNKSLPAERTTQLNILIQINTSGEDAKSGLPPLTADADAAKAELTQLARHIVAECPRLRLQGLMTIGALEQSLHAGEANADFERLKGTRDVLAQTLTAEFGEVGKWGAEGTGRLLLSMGMSSDFEAALKAGSDIVRVGTGIFGARPKK
ncbi:proline synthetase associated protein [Mycena vitilis]|nr:proline synthetase associated protein [Mycena vitilis]